MNRRATPARHGSSCEARRLALKNRLDHCIRAPASQASVNMLLWASGKIPLLVTALALAVVVLMALYMLALGAAALLIPAWAGRFLRGFASTPSVHFAELFLRLLAGAALVQYAPYMHYSSAFRLFGWVLLITTTALVFVPWRWHRRFTEQAVSRVTPYIALVGLTSMAIGGFALFALTRGWET